MARRKPSFEEWMREVDRVLVARCGLDHRDLEDWAYRDAYDAGKCARAAAVAAVRAANGEG